MLKFLAGVVVGISVARLNKPLDPKIRHKAAEGVYILSWRLNDLSNKLSKENNR